jgi:hypothetical protein
VIPWVRVGSGFYSLFLHCLRAELPFRCKQAFFREEKCLLDHLSPFGTSCSPSFSPSIIDLLLNQMSMHKNTQTFHCWFRREEFHDDNHGLKFISKVLLFFQFPAIGYFSLVPFVCVCFSSVLDPQPFVNNILLSQSMKRLHDSPLVLGYISY